MSFSSQALISDADYSAIEDALHSTEKGRRFLRTYVDRNRSIESRRLLRSISRLHNAALGSPGLHAEISRDLISVLNTVAKHRVRASGSKDANVRLEVLAGGIEHAEAALLALIESIEERSIVIEQTNDPVPLREDRAGANRSAKLYGELSSYFSGEPL